MKNVKIKYIFNTKTAREHKAGVERAVLFALEKISKHIPVSNVSITIKQSPQNISFGGMAGQTSGKKNVTIVVDVKAKQFSKFLNKEMVATLGHELYHVARINKIGYPKNLLANCIDEGLACCFEKELIGRYPAYCTSLTAGQLQKVVKLASLEFGAKKYNHNDWFYGSKKRGIPPYAGYNLGCFFLLKVFKNKQKLPPSKLFAKKFE